MNRRRHAILAVLAWLAVGGCGDGAGPAWLGPEMRAAVLRHSPVGSPPSDPTNPVGDTPAAVRFGQWLFFDRRFSADGTLACASCHDPARGWGDGQRLGQGLATTRRHTPTLWNVAWNRWFFWDGRADSAWAQALQPMEHPAEQGGDRLAFAHLVTDDPALRAAYEDLFGALPDLADAGRFPARAHPRPTEPLHPDHRAWTAMREDDREAIDRVFVNLGRALAAYERRIVSDGAPFDVFCDGLRQRDAKRMAVLPASARRGLVLFFGRGRCATCHAGPGFTDGEFHDTGLASLAGAVRDRGRAEGVRTLLADPFNGMGAYAQDGGAGADRPIRYLVPQPEHDGQFKTPTLRNVAETAPYMHDGRFARLEDVVRYYSTLEGALFSGHHREVLLRPLLLDDGEIDDLVAFLSSLTGAPIDPALTVPPPSPVF